MSKNNRASDPVVAAFSLSILDGSLFDFEWHFGAPEQNGVVIHGRCRWLMSGRTTPRPM